MNARTASKHNDLTPETIEAALFSISADVDRMKWARVGMALKSELGEGGFQLFDAWSRTASRGYNARDCADTWKSISGDGGVGIATLIYEAQQNGFQLGEDRPRISAEEVERREAERRERDKAEKARKKQLQGEAAKYANLALETATRATDDHEYLANKNVRAHGLLLGEWPLFKKDAYEPFRHIPGALLVPIQDAKTGKVISLQGMFVDDQGEVQKRYLKNGRKMGGFHMIGRPPEPEQIVAFCEGYATGATIHELTGWCVIVCFDAANLPNIAQTMRPQFLHNPFLICADNDQWSKTGEIENPGMHYAAEAARKSRGHVLAPDFADLAGEPSDWNDLACREGDHVARQQLFANPVSQRQGGGALEKPQAGGEVIANDNVDLMNLPFISPRGKPLPAMENLQEIMRRADIHVCYNVITKDTEIHIPGEEYLEDVRRASALTRLKNYCTLADMATEQVQEQVLYLSGQNPYNPIAKFIYSKPWDGKSRFPELIASVSTRADFDRDLFAMLLRRWLISAVAAAVKPAGFWSKGVLVFQGEQSLGKTSWFRELLPPDLRRLLKEGAILDPANKDTVISAVSHWMVELGELDGTFRKADIARLKAFISQVTDLFRRPYGRVEEAFQRRTVFFASVNPEQFLADDTGNVRWWTVPVVELDLAHGLDMQQVWAEVATWYEAGERWWLEPDEEKQLEAANAHHAQGDPIKERLQQRLDWDANALHWSYLTATEILLAVGVDRPTKQDVANCGRVMKNDMKTATKRSNGRNLILCPPQKRERSNDDRPF